MAVIGMAERDAADHAAVVGQTEVAADQARVACERGLRNGAEAKRLGCQHEFETQAPQSFAP